MNAICFNFLNKTSRLSCLTNCVTSFGLKISLEQDIFSYILEMKVISFINFAKADIRIYCLKINFANRNFIYNKNIKLKVRISNKTKE